MNVSSQLHLCYKSRACKVGRTVITADTLSAQSTCVGCSLCGKNHLHSWHFVCRTNLCRLLTMWEGPSWQLTVCLQTQPVQATHHVGKAAFTADSLSPDPTCAGSMLCGKNRLHNFILCGSILVIHHSRSLITSSSCSLKKNIGNSCGYETLWLWNFLRYYFRRPNFLPMCLYTDVVLL